MKFFGRSKEPSENEQDENEQAQPKPSLLGKTLNKGKSLAKAGAVLTLTTLAMSGVKETFHLSIQQLLAKNAAADTMPAFDPHQPKDESVDLNPHVRRLVFRTNLERKYDVPMLANLLEASPEKIEQLGLKNLQVRNVVENYIKENAVSQPLMEPYLPVNLDILKGGLKVYVGFGKGYTEEEKNHLLGQLHEVMGYYGRELDIPYGFAHTPDEATAKIFLTDDVAKATANTVKDHEEGVSNMLDPVTIGAKGSGNSLPVLVENGQVPVAYYDKNRLKQAALAKRAAVDNLMKKHADMYDGNKHIYVQGDRGSLEQMYKRLEDGAAKELFADAFAHAMGLSAHIPTNVEGGQVPSFLTDGETLHTEENLSKIYIKIANVDQEKHSVTFRINPSLATTNDMLRKNDPAMGVLRVGFDHWRKVLKDQAAQQ